jgi:hypothetical protein
VSAHTEPTVMVRAAGVSRTLEGTMEPDRTGNSLSAGTEIPSPTPI